MKSFLEFVALILCLVFIGYSIYANYDRILAFFYGEPTHIINIQGARFFATLADTAEERQQGLSGTSELEELQVMLFAFDTNDRHGIWMKDMNYPTRVFWVSEDFQIIHIERRVGPESYPKTFKPSRPARYVIESRANVAEAFNINVGDLVIFPDSLMKEILLNK